MYAKPVLIGRDPVSATYLFSSNQAGGAKFAEDSVDNLASGAEQLCQLPLGDGPDKTALSPAIARSRLAKRDGATSRLWRTWRRRAVTQQLARHKSYETTQRYLKAPIRLRAKRS